MVTDEQLLNFRGTRIHRFDAAKAREALQGEHADLYRNHLLIARWLEAWLAGMNKLAKSPLGSNGQRQKGIDYGLNELAAHLRKGDFLPGGTLYEQEVRRTD